MSTNYKVNTTKKELDYLRNQLYKLESERDRYARNYPTNVEPGSTPVNNNDSAKSRRAYYFGGNNSYGGGIRFGEKRHPYMKKLSALDTSIENLKEKIKEKEAKLNSLNHSSFNNKEEYI